MSEIDIVPPFELCKRIPAEEFDNSTLIWEEKIDEISRVTLKIRGKDDKPWGNWIKKVNIYPAPTLQEILSVLPEGVQVRMRSSKSGERHYQVYHYSAAQWTNRPAAAALRLWLKIQGGKEI